jgi:putative nucleotidyltransferase with HDIG domain
MRNKKIRSVKRASFYGMLKYSIPFLIINFIIVCVFTAFLAYFLISSYEENITNVLISDISLKENNIKNISENIAEIIASPYIEKKNKEVFIDTIINREEDILGSLIIDDKGIISHTSEKYGNLIGYDFSKREYIQKALIKKKTIVSEPYVAYETKQFIISVASPIKRKDDILGVVVILVDSTIIHNDKMRGLNYYVANMDGDIIFNSGYKGLHYQDNILDSILMKNINENISEPLFYKDKVRNKYLLSTIKVNKEDSMYLVVEYEIFNKIFLNGLIIVFFLAALFVSLFLFLSSAKFSNIASEYSTIFTSELQKITKGNYDVDLSNMYPITEVNRIVSDFLDMAHKVNQREQELQVYNEELRAANDEINNMLITINKNKKDKKEQYIKIISTMLNLIEIKDEYTAGHSISVTEYSQQIAKKLNKDYGFNFDIEKIRVGAMLHDIGKIGIETKILNKPTRLTREEFEIIKTHPVKGFYALKEIDNFRTEREIVKYHHERYDGGGYPEGIKGDEISFEARIVCVADAFDAMTSDRSYRKSLPINTAVEELIKNKGTQFDPLIIDVFVGILKGGNKIGREYV